MAEAGIWLPGTGTRDDVGRVIKGNIRQLLTDILADPPGHAYAVASGQTHFRQVFTRHMGYLFGNDRANCDYFADLVFQFAVGQWRAKYPGLTPQQFLDKHEPVTPPTEQEIEDAWELEIAGSDEALRKFYEGSARVRKGRDLGSKRPT